jgi:hypothetical protein
MALRIWSIISLAIMVAILFAARTYAGGLPEAYYQKAWCDAERGQSEVVLADRTRVDCRTLTHVVEFDFAPKWAECVGQALHYSATTGQRGMCVLISGPDDEKYVTRVRGLAEKFGLPLDVDVMRQQ